MTTLIILTILTTLTIVAVKVFNRAEINPTTTEPTPEPTNWDAIFAKMEQDNQDLLAQQELAEIVRSLTEEIVSALEVRRYDGVECIEFLANIVREFLYSDDFEVLARKNLLDVVGHNIEGTWLHTMPEEYLPNFSSYQREVCVSSVENGVTFGESRPVLVLKGVCRYLFSANANSLLTPDQNGRLDRHYWAHPMSMCSHDEGWLWVPTSEVVEILVPTEDMKTRVMGLGYEVTVIPSEGSRQEFIWNRYEVPVTQRGVTPSNI